MKVKIRNVLILLLGILVFGTIICSNQVNATEVDEAYLEDIINMLPDSMNLDIPEVEYEKAQNLVLEKIKEILQNNGIESRIVEDTYIALEGITFNGQDVKIYAGASMFYLDIDEFHKAGIDINGVKKVIEIVYNNSKNYNTTDESYVKNIKIEKVDYFGIDIEEITSDSLDSFEFVAEYYTKLLNDDSIVIKFASGSGGGDVISFQHDLYVGVFKNNILYNVTFAGMPYFIPVVNVPNTINDNEVNDYVVEQIEKYYKDKFEGNDVSITDIKKGATANDKEITNGYTVYFNDSYCDYVIVNREVEVDTTDTTTNIKLETTSNVVPEGTKLVVEKITTGESYNTVVATLGDDIDKFVLYDITLESNGVEVQPNGKVKISIPIPEGFNKEKLVVYRINEDETKVKYDVKVETVEGKEYATFETDHFSLYTLAMEKVEETTNQNATTNNNTSSNDNNKLDETPKTGNFGTIEIISLVALISLIAIVVLKKNNK